MAHSYADGQYWDDTDYVLPPTAAYAEVRLYYQTTSREYVEFLLVIMGALKAGYSAARTDEVQAILGRVPRSLETYVHDYSAQLGGAAA